MAHYITCNATLKMLNSIRRWSSKSLESDLSTPTVPKWPDCVVICRDHEWMQTRRRPRSNPKESDQVTLIRDLLLQKSSRHVRGLPRTWRRYYLAGSGRGSTSRQRNMASVLLSSVPSPASTTAYRVHASQHPKRCIQRAQISDSPPPSPPHDNPCTSAIIPARSSDALTVPPVDDIVPSPHRARFPHPVAHPPMLSSTFTPDAGAGFEILLVYMSGSKKSGHTQAPAST